MNCTTTIAGTSETFLIGIMQSRRERRESDGGGGVRD